MLVSDFYGKIGTGAEKAPQKLEKHRTCLASVANWVKCGTNFLISDCEQRKYPAVADNLLFHKLKPWSSQSSLYLSLLTQTV